MTCEKVAHAFRCTKPHAEGLQTAILVSARLQPISNGLRGASRVGAVGSRANGPHGRAAAGATCRDRGSTSWVSCPQGCGGGRLGGKHRCGGLSHLLIVMRPALTPHVYWAVAGYQSAAREPRAGTIAHTPPGANAIGHEAASLFSLFNVQPGQRPTQAGQRPQAGQLGAAMQSGAMQPMYGAMQPVVPAAAVPTSSQSVASLVARIQCAQNPRGCMPPPPAPRVPPPPHPPYHPHRPRNCAEYCDSSTCHNSAYSECFGCGPAQGCSSPPPKPPPRPPNPPPPSPVPPEPPPPPPPSPPSPPLPPHPVSLTEMRDIFMQELQQQKAEAKASKVAAKAAKYHALKHPSPSSPPPSTPPPSMFGSVLTSWPVLLVLSAVGNALLFALCCGGASGEPRDWQSPQEARVSRGADALGLGRKPLQDEQSRRRVAMRAIKVHAASRPVKTRGGTPRASSATRIQERRAQVVHPSYPSVRKHLNHVSIISIT